MSLIMIIQFDFIANIVFYRHPINILIQANSMVLKVQNLINKPVNDMKLTFILTY